MKRLALLAVLMLSVGCGDDGGGPEGVCDLAALPGDLVITEIMANAKGADAGQEWIEIYNASTVAQCLNGMTIHVQGTTKAESHVIISDKAVEVQPGAYLVLGGGAFTFLAYSWATDAGFSDGAFIDGGSVVSLRIGAEAIDAVGYGEVSEPNAPEAKEGRTLALCGECLQATCNDTADKWAMGTDAYDGTNLGSPGLANAACGCGDGSARAPVAGDFRITEIFGNTPGNENTDQEWFELHILAQDAPINFAGVGVVKTKGEAPVFKLESCFAGQPNSYIVFGGSKDTAVNGGVTVNVEYEKLTLNNSNGYLALVGADGAPLTEVEYKSLEEGKALQFDESTLVWCDAGKSYAEGFFGSPGEANPACGACFCKLNGAWIESARPGAGDLAITEVFPNTPGNENPDMEWFEVKVTAAADVDLNCIELWKGADETKATHVVAAADNACLRFPAGANLLFARSNDPNENGIPPASVTYVYSSLTLSGEGDLLLKLADTVIDTASWENVPDGVAVQKDPTTGMWCPAVNQYWSVDDDGDLKAALGTPGGANTACGVEYCTENGVQRPAVPPVEGDLVINEIFPNPDGADTKAREWVEVMVLPSGAGKDLNAVELFVNGDSKGKVGDATGECIKLGGSFAVLIGSADSAVNGGIVGGYVLPGIQLGNENGTVVLKAGGAQIDSMAYAKTVDGKAWQLDPSKATPEWNDDPGAWCDAAVTFNATPEYGTPGTENKPCGAAFCNDLNGAAKQVTPPVPAGLVISEIYPNTPGNEDPNKEWFEVTVPAAAAPFQFNGVGLLTESGKPPSVFFNSDHCIEMLSGGIYVFCRNADPALNGALPAGCIPYSSISLTNDHGYLGLGIPGTLYDYVPDYGKSKDGVARSLDPDKTTSVDNDDPNNWCDTPAGNTYGDGTTLGTPGLKNPQCPE